MLTMTLGWLWGLGQGLRHALEPDHVAAVSTVVAEQRGPRASATFAAAWGAGHALVLLLFGGALTLLRAELSESVAAVFELLVAVMLLVLGARGIVLAVAAWRVPRTPAAHTHRTAPFGLARPVAIGVVHGLAGSGALTALVLAQWPSPAQGLVFIALYGLGAMVGMAILAGIAGIPLARFVQSRRGVPIVLGASGAFSLVLGFVWGVPILAQLAAG
jgi:hypothetical protein